MCKALGMYVIGVKRKPIERPDYLDELYLNNDLYEAVSDVDAVISVLPGNKFLRSVSLIKNILKSVA